MERERERSPAGTPDDSAAAEPVTSRFLHDRQLLAAPAHDHARRQHVGNLVFLMRHYAATRDWGCLAGVAAALVASDRPDNLSSAWMFRHAPSRTRLAEALQAGWLLLEEQPGAMSYEQSLRFLKLWAVYQLAPAGKDVVHLRLASFSRMQGHPTDAWDFLVTQRFATAQAEGERRAIMGSIRVYSWADAMRGTAELELQSARPSASPNKQRHTAVRRAGWQPWQHDARLWARGGRMAKELHQDALECCQGALEQQPEESCMAQLVAQLHLAADAADGALQVARSLRESAPLNADGAGLLAVLLIAQPAPAQAGARAGAGRMLETEVAQAAACCCQLLATEPQCHAAAAALLALHAQHSVPAAELVAGCCCYLDAQPPSWQPPLLELRVWQHLASTLLRASTALVALQQQLDDLQQQRRRLLPRSLQEAQRRLCSNASGTGTASEDRLHELTRAAADVQRCMAGVLCDYQDCCHVVQGRLWWRDAHLLSQPAAVVMAALESGTASPAALVAHAAVAAFLHPLWQQLVVQQWRPAASLPRSVRNLMLRHTASALAQAGHGESAGALRAAAKLCRQAAAVVVVQASSRGNAAAALLSLPRRQVGFWRAARRLGKAGPNLSPRLGRHAPAQPWHAALPWFPPRPPLHDASPDRADRQTSAARHARMQQQPKAFGALKGAEAAGPGSELTARRVHFLLPALPNAADDAGRA